MTLGLWFGLVGHILCGECDGLLTYGEKGRLDFKNIKDAEKMSAMFENMPLPPWACVFNTLPLMLILTPTRLPAKGNIAGAIMFAGLLFFIH